MLLNNIHVIIALKYIILENISSGLVLKSLLNDHNCYQYSLGLSADLITPCIQSITILTVVLPGHVSLAEGKSDPFHLSRDMGFPTMWFVRPAKPQISLRICAF